MSSLGAAWGFTRVLKTIPAAGAAADEPHVVRLQVPVVHLRKGGCMSYGESAR